MRTDGPITSPQPLLAPAPSASISPDALRQQLRIAQHWDGKLKGRQPDDGTVAELQALIGPGPYRGDQLIELLRVLNDHRGALLQRHFGVWWPWRPSSNWA